MFTDSVTLRLRSLIASQGSTQSQVADDLGMNRQSLNKMLHGDDIRCSLLLRILDALDVTPADFFGGEAIPSAPSVLQDRLREKDRIIALLEEQVQLLRREVTRLEAKK